MTVSSRQRRASRRVATALQAGKTRLFVRRTFVRIDVAADYKGTIAAGQALSTRSARETFSFVTAAPARLTTAEIAA
jgi:hypothetical protein